MADRFIGTWRLVSFVARSAEGGETQTFGFLPRGYLMYDRGGRVSVHIARSDRRADNESADYFGYFGTYSVDEDAGTVTHHVEGASDPVLVSTDQLRSFTLEGDQLILSTAAGPAAKAGTTYVATWERSSSGMGLEAGGRS